MCKFNKVSGNKRIDPCMRTVIEGLHIALQNHLKVVAYCCGHQKYSTTIVMYNKSQEIYYDLLSGIKIPRKKRYYFRDKKGYYYIPEVENVKM